MLTLARANRIIEAILASKSAVADFDSF